MYAALNATTLIGSTTNTPLALSAALNVFLAEGRPTATNIMLLVTDGHGAIDNSWTNYYYGNISLISSLTRAQRFGKYKLI